MLLKKGLFVLLFVITLFLILNRLGKKVNLNPGYSIGQKIDSLNNVYVFYNGGQGNVEGRNTKNGYNIGLKYQCVEFIKRYYLEHYKHKMPNSYGHAIHFYDPKLKDGGFNKERALYQFSNPSRVQPKEGDIIVMNKTRSNEYGHVGIISKVKKREVEMIQQNAGPFSPSRVSLSIKKFKNGNWCIKNDRVLGWLSMEKE